jgi:hypothetical protein
LRTAVVATLGLTALALATAGPPALAALPAPGPAPAAAALPPDFPADVPLPAGELQAATGGGGQWSVLLLEPGSAAAVHGSAVAFYAGHGFVAETDSVLHDARHRITIVVQNRDHSPNATFLAIGVTTLTTTAGPAPAPAAPGVSVTLAARLGGQARATVALSGGRACWRIIGLGRAAGLRAAAVRRGVHGPVVLRLGRRFRRSGCVSVPAAVADAIANRAGALWLTVTRRAHRATLRGRLVAV